MNLLMQLRKCSEFLSKNVCCLFYPIFNIVNRFQTINQEMATACLKTNSLDPTLKGGRSRDGYGVCHCPVKLRHLSSFCLLD